MSDTNRRPNITVVGDLILDRYLIGDATKLNPEMPGVVIRVEKEDDRLGGAAAVAMLAAGFGGKVTLAGVVGDDEPGHRLRELLDAHGVESHVACPSPAGPAVSSRSDIPTNRKSGTSCQ